MSGTFGCAFLQVRRYGNQHLYLLRDNEVDRAKRVNIGDRLGISISASVPCCSRSILPMKLAVDSDVASGESETW